MIVLNYPEKSRETNIEEIVKAGEKVLLLSLCGLVKIC